MTADLEPIPAYSAVPAVLVGDEQVALLKRTLAAEANLTDDELALFVNVARRRGLDPFTGQIHATKRQGRLVIQTGIDGFRVTAERTGRYGGELPYEWCGPDGVWVDVWLNDGPPAAARAAVVRRDHTQPTSAVAHWTGYVQLTRDGHPAARWATDPAGMLAKCALSLALRKAFPADLSGIYTDDEMGQADNDPPPTVETVDTQQPQRSRRPATPEAQPDRPTGAQNRKLQTLFGVHGVNDRRERLTITSTLAGRDIGSTSDLSVMQMSKVIDRLVELIEIGPTLQEAYAALVAGGDDEATVDAEGLTADDQAGAEGERADGLVFDIDVQP